jgi:hypothetical protein
MPAVVKARWVPTASSWLARSARGACDYEAYVPDRLADRSFVLYGETAADAADAERAVEQLQHEARSLADSEAVADCCARSSPSDSVMTRAT